MFDQRHVSKSLSPLHKATKEWRFSCDTAERYISAVVRKFKQCGAKDLDLTEVWAYRQIKKGWKRSRPPSLKAARRPITIDILAAMLPDFDMSDEFDRMAWMSITTAQNGFFRLGELLRASKQNIFPRRAHLRFVSTEHVQLKLMRRKNAPPGQAVLVDYFCNGTPHSAVIATRNALGLPDNFTGIVAGGDLAIFRSNGAEIFKPAIIKRLQRALKRAGFDPDLHSGTACAKAERRISLTPASSCATLVVPADGPKAAPHCACTAMSLLLLALAGPSGPPTARTQDRASNSTYWISIKSR